MKKVPHYISITALTILAAPLSSRAQVSRNVNPRDTTIKTQHLDIYATYKPEIAPAPKPQYIPTLPVLDTNAIKPVFNYNVPQQNLSFTYKSAPLRPLAFKAEDAVLPFQNYMKLGLGNINSLLIDAGIGSIRGTDYDATIHFKHLSQKGKDLFQQSSLNGLDASGNYYLKDHTLSASLSFNRNAHYQYGFDTALYHPSKNDVKQVFTGLAVQVALANSTPAVWNLWYKPEIGISSYNDKMGAVERTFNFDVPLRKQFDSVFSAGVGLKGIFTQFKNDSGNYANNYVQITPAVDIHLPAVDFHIAAYPTFAKDSKVYVLPDIYAKTKLAQNKLSIFAGWKGELIQNTYKELSGVNPFINNIYDIKQGISTQIYGGFESSLSSHLTVGATLSYRKWKNMALFVNDYNTTIDGRSFKVLYDDVNALNFEAEILYQISKKFWVKGNGSWQAFDASQNEKAWHQPAMMINGGFGWSPSSKFNFGANLHYWDRMFTQLADGSAKKLPAFADLSLSAEYNIIPRLSVFANVNNILNQHYQVWNQYEVYGFNIIGGIRFKF